MTSFTAVVSGRTTITARGAVRQAAERVLGRLWIDEVPVRLASEDPGLWPSTAAAAADAAGRSWCWPGQPGPARLLLDRLAALRAAARAAGTPEVVLIGDGAAARAAAAIAAHAAVPLTVLGGTEPGPLLRLADDTARLARAVFVLTGDDPDHEAAARVLAGLLRERDLSPADRFVTVAEPGTAAAKYAGETGHPLVEAPAAAPFAALSPQALVPAGLAGADVAGLLDRASAMLPALTRPENNPGLVLGAILGGAARAGRDTVVLGGYAAALPELADWIALLLTDATRGRLLPLVQHGGLPVQPADDLFLVTLDGRPRQDDATVSGPLAEQLVVWEYAAAVAAYLVGADPFAPVPLPAPFPGPGADRSASAADPVSPSGPSGREVAAYTADPVFASAASLDDLAAGVADRAAGEGHLTIVAFLDPDPVHGEGAQVRRLAALLAARCARPVTIAWGCRYPAFGNDRREKGVYLVLTGDAGGVLPHH
ncbi:hypothetical protein ACSNOI_29745, partial [Actinomadura kijaniata]|uniref:hypothetical protein n=1 Tax=Actinomadura kijaniata TaxID=46161 RepID=UPI003F1CA3C4